MQKIKLKTSVKYYQGYKNCSPEETVNHLSGQLKKINIRLKIKPMKKRIATRVGLDLSYCSFQNFTSDGKGLTPELSKASAIAEFIERISAGYITENTKKYYNYLIKKSKEKGLFTSYNQLKKHNAQLTEPTLFLSTYPPNTIKNPKKVLKYLKNLKMPWEPFHTLDGEEFFLPSIWIDRCERSNGLAAGNTLEEAIMQALCEVIERHVHSIIIWNKINPPTIDLSSIEDPTVKDLIQRFKKARINIIAKDLSLDFSIPSIGVYFFDELFDDNGVPYLSMHNPKFIVGTASSPEEAMTRCLTEYIQSSADISAEFFDKFKAESNKVLSLGLQPEKFPPTFVSPECITSIDLSFLEKSVSFIHFSDLPSLYNKDYKREIETMVNLLKKKGLMVLVKNLTKSSLTIPVVRVFIPHASHPYKYCAFHPLGHMLGVYDALNQRETTIQFFREHKDIIIKDYAAVQYTPMIKYALETGMYKQLADKLLSFIKTDLGFRRILGYDVFELMAFLYLLHLDRPEKAIMFLEVCRKNRAHEPHLLAAVGYAYKKLGNVDEAEQIYNNITTHFSTFDINQFENEMNSPLRLGDQFDCDLNCKRCQDEHNVVAERECMWYKVPFDLLWKPET